MEKEDLFNDRLKEKRIVNVGYRLLFFIFHGTDAYQLHTEGNGLSNKCTNVYILYT